jgi:2,3-bisphosphoglycerate-dependent phosphoglycerate mutase
MKIIVIRHGESIADVLNVIEGRADFELTVNGFKQAVKMSEYVNKNFIV